MSALGQKRTYAVQSAMSALDPLADILHRNEHVRITPQSDHLQSNH